MGMSIEKFNKLDLDERSIVFYSESSVILYPYVEEIIRELQNRNQKICYVTSQVRMILFSKTRIKTSKFFTLVTLKLKK